MAELISDKRGTQCAALIAAAGMGVRFGADMPKAFFQIDGRSLLERSARLLSSHPAVSQLVVAVPGDFRTQAATLLQGLEIDVQVIAGGAERQDSVAAMMSVVDEQCQFVLVHDAARAFTPISVVDRVIAALTAGAAAAIPVLPVVDTIAQVGASSSAPATLLPHAEPIVGNVPRSGLRIVQTPQGFQRRCLQEAHERYPGSEPATDDASMVAWLGEQVWAVPGDARALKITVAHDVAIVRALAD